MGTLVIMSEIMKLDETIDKIMTKTESGIVSELDKILDGAKSSLKTLKTRCKPNMMPYNGIEKQIIGSSNLD